jgi:xylulokinase
MGYFCVLEIGTTTVKSFIVDEYGRILSKQIEEYESIVLKSGEHEQNPETWWQLAISTLNSAVKKAGINTKDITSLSMVTQRATVIPLGRDGTPLSNAITWMDAREPSLSEEEKKLLKQRVPLKKILWLKDRKKSLFNSTYKFALTDSYLSQKLVGEVYSSPSQGIYLYYDPDVGKYREDILERLDIPLEKLPGIVDSATVIGDLKREAAEELGLPSGIPVIMGSGDQQCSALGLGLINDGVKMTLGTGTFIDAVVKSKLFEFYEETTHLFMLPHAIKGKWLIEAVLPGTGASLKWFLETLGDIEKREALDKGLNPYKLLDMRAERSPVGANGLLVIPLFSFGKGQLIDLSFKVNKDDLFRAFLEGSALGAKFFLDLMQSLDIEISELRVDGGGSNSEIWLQIHADVSGLPLRISSAGAHAEIIGAVILSAYAIRIMDSIEKAVNQFVKFDHVIQPNEERLEKYLSIYEVFLDKMLEVSEKLEV